MAEEKEDDGKVNFKCTDVFSDSITSRHFSFGTYRLDEATAVRLSKAGKGQIVKEEKKAESKTAATSEKSNQKTTATSEKSNQKTNANNGAKETELPEKMPHREELIGLGADTVEKIETLGEKGLTDLKLSKAKVTKVGLFLSEMKEKNEQK